MIVAVFVLEVVKKIEGSRIQRLSFLHALLSDAESGLAGSGSKVPAMILTC